MTTTVPNFYGLSRDALAEQLSRQGQPPYRANQLFSWIYRRHRRSSEQMTNLPLALRR